MDAVKAVNPKGVKNMPSIAKTLSGRQYVYSDPNKSYYEVFAPDEFMSRVVWENDEGYYVYSDPKKSFYQVFAPDVTCAYRIASIGKSIGLDRCLKEVSKHMDA